MAWRWRLSLSLSIRARAQGEAGARHARTSQGYFARRRAQYRAYRDHRAASHGFHFGSDKIRKRCLASEDAWQIVMEVPS
jgi:hypothetical protein